jgi:hypothetical protein
MADKRKRVFEEVPISQKKQLIDIVFLSNMFKKTYNSNYLKFLSKNQILELRLSLYDNPILQKLIDNYLKSPSEKKYLSVKYIEGPYVIYHYGLENIDGNKTVYLFGESHSNTTGHCDDFFRPEFTMTFVNYIKSLMENTPSFFDLYVELNLMSPFEKQDETKTELPSNLFLNKDAIFLDMILNPSNFETARKKITDDSSKYKETSSSTLQDIFNNLNKCIVPTDDICKLMRIHLLDARNNYKFENKLGILSSILSFFYRNMAFFPTNLSISFKNLIKKTGTNLILQEIIKNKKEHINIQTNSLFEILLKNRWVKKQYNKTYYQTKISNFIKLEIKKMLKSSKNQLDCLENLFNLTINIKNNITKNDIIKSSLFLINFQKLEMDLYSLCRIFKRYTHRQPNHNQPEESYVILVYCGANHINTYRNFLVFIKHMNIPFKKRYSFINTRTYIEDTEENIKGCIDISDQRLVFPTREDTDSDTDSDETELPYTEPFGEYTDETALPYAEYTDETALPYAEYTDETALPYAEYTDETALPYGSSLPALPYGSSLPALPYGSSLPYGDETALPYGSSLPELPYGEYGDETELPYGEYGDETALPYAEYTDETALPYGSSLPYGDETALPYGDETALPYGDETALPYGSSLPELPYGEYGDETALPYGSSLPALPFR